MNDSLLRFVGGYDDELPDWQCFVDLGDIDSCVQWRRLDEWPVA